MQQQDLPASVSSSDKATADKKIMADMMEKIVSLCKRRGFVFPGSEIYGGLANSWDYGPLGVELKNNIKQLWWKRFVQQRDDMVGIDAALVMNPKVWEASGHLATFTDPLIECKNCHERFRADHLFEKLVTDGTTWADEMEKLQALPEDERLAHVQEVFKECPNCKAKQKFALPKQFNLMLKTFLGPAEEAANVACDRRRAPSI